MPRRARIEYEGAFYHLLCRGDRRDAIFLDNEDRQGFLTTLGEACERSGFVVHSYVLMDNHYHLLLETPAGNLVAGMKWFQGTYTARFNARHRLRGHLFAGRYKAVLVEGEEPAYGRVVSDYIHLNPARAGIVNAKNPQLRTYKWSSFPIFCGEGKPPKWLRAADVFSWQRLDWRRAADRRAYGKYLQRRAEESWKEQSRRKAREAGELLKELRSGWILGGEAFRDRMLNLAAGVVREKRRESFGGEELRAYDVSAAKKLLERGLGALGETLVSVRPMRRNDPRKQGLAWLIKSNTMAGDEWITRKLDMGHRSNVSRAVGAFRSESSRTIKRLKHRLHICTDFSESVCQGVK
jgi:putative transposase